MNITPNQNINFGAKLIKLSPVKKLADLKGEYMPAKLSFVEFEPGNKKDLQAISNAVKSWNGEMFASDIYTSAKLIRNRKLDPESHKIYVLTSQKNNFDNLNADEIVGLADFETNKPDEGHLNFLQVDPDLITSYVPPRFRYVGTGMLEALKSLYKKTITLKSVYSATAFYEKNGFKLIDFESLLYKWSKEK